MFTFALVGLSARAALAAPPEDCPPGSVGKDESGFQWCEPTVCITDADCLGGKQVCRPMPLCVEIGNLNDAASGKRLSVHNKCAANKECPAQTTCLEGNRCIDRDAADRMGILVLDAGAPPEPPKKSVCGCSVPGVPTSELVWMGPVALVGLAVVRRRRRR